MKYGCRHCISLTWKEKKIKNEGEQVKINERKSQKEDQNVDQLIRTAVDERTAIDHDWANGRSQKHEKRRENDSAKE